MTTKTKRVAPIPRGFRAVTAHITVADVAAASALYQRALGASEVDRVEFIDSETPAFAQLRIGNSLITLGQGEVYGTGAVSLHHYVEDFDAAWTCAIDAGFAVISQPAETTWGDVMGTLADPFGVRWSVAQRVERLTREEKAERALALAVAVAHEIAPQVTQYADVLASAEAPGEQLLN